jgi:hypothetical protein
MANYREYFECVGYKPKYLIGDRVRGIYNNIPFVGTVGNDTLISLDEGARVSVHLDLPMQLTDSVKNIIIVKHKDIQSL